MWILQCLGIIGFWMWTNSEKVILLNTSINGWTNWTKNTKKFEGWRIQNLPPNGDEVYGVCDVQQQSANSWLRSPFIPRDNGVLLYINVSYTMRECKSYPDPKSLKHCEEIFTLYKYESESPNEIIQYNEKSFGIVKTISPSRKWENKDRTEEILNLYNTSMSIRRAGVIIAFRSAGSCVMIKEVVIYYLSCTEKIRNFTYFPRTAAGFQTRLTIGKCVEGAVNKQNKQNVDYCEIDGKWKNENMKDICECGAGMEGNENQTQCQKCKYNHYKPFPGSSYCKPCPKNTQNHMDSKSCVCTTGFYEIPRKDKQIYCKKPPDKPKKMHVETSDQARIVLSWSPPFNSDSPEMVNDNQTYFKVECENCPNKILFLPSSQTFGSNVTVLGCLPSREYSFKVITVNEVSQYVTNSFDIHQSYSKISMLTKPLENLDLINIILMKKEIDGIFILWNKPISPNDIWEYECVLYGFQEVSTNPDLNNASYVVHAFTNNTSLLFSNISLEFIQFVSKVRPRNSKGWGHFGRQYLLALENQRRSLEKFSKKKITRPITTSPISVWTDTITSNGTDKDMIMMVVGSILLVAVLLIIIVLVTYCIRRQMVFNVYRQKFKNDKFETCSPGQIIYSSAYSLPNQTYNKYQNPNTYEDISIALHDFTKEIDPQWISTSTIIGEGEFGNVFQGILSIPEEEQRMVAVKVLKNTATEKEKNDFLIEASTMGQFLNENVIKLEGVVTSSDPYMIITEYMVNGSLLTYLQTKKNELSTAQLLKMLSNIASGMKYLSAIGFIHRDLAARNILLDENLVCKVADFGLSRELSGKDAEEIYTNKPDGKLPIKWTAPEAILYGKFSHAADVWSFGVLAWEIMSFGEKPYWQWSNHEVLDAIQSGYRLPPPVNCPPIIHNLMLHCWNLNTDKRPTFSHLYFEIEQISSQLCSNTNKYDLERKEFKNCETAHLLMHCNDLNKDPIYEISAPQPPPRNLFLDIRGSKIAVAPEINGLYSMQPRKSFGCLNSPRSNDLTNNSTLIEDGSQTITLTRMNYPNHLHQPYQYFQNKTFYPPYVSPVNHDHHSYSPDLFSTKFPEIPPHKKSLPNNKSLHISIEEFLTKIHLSHFIPNFLKNGIYYTDQISHIKTERLTMMGILSINDQKKIIRALQPPMYC